MELSIESPSQNVTWKISDYFQLLSKSGYSLNSPDFHFAGDRYCLRFYPKGNNNGDTVDTDLQIVRLTFNFPERIVLYKVGFRTEYERDIYIYSGTLIGEFGFCLSRSQLEEDHYALHYTYVEDGTLTVVCSVCLKQSGAGSPRSEEAGNSHAEEKPEGLPETPESVSCAVQRETPDIVSCAVQRETPDSVSCAVQRETPDSVSCAVQRETPDSVSCAVQRETPDSVSCAVQRETPDSVSCAVQRETPDSVSSAVQRETPDSVVDKEVFKNEDCLSRDTKENYFM